jgi:iron complex outermembrane recepter protein
MKRTICNCLILFYVTINCQAQEEPTDSSYILGNVTVRAFEQNRKQHSTTANVKIIDFRNSDRYNKSSLVNSFNSIAGVRMEERSPGSYRINIRGSSLRSPFGVRNVKVYWNDIPVTDPGGNTYFNQFAFNDFSSIEIYKGPAGSLYGAGTGGLILMNNLDRWQPGADIEYVTGSYNLQNIFTSARFGSGENRNQVTYAHNQSDGYRVQTKMRRDNFTWSSRVKLSDKQELRGSVLFTDMYYQTPGALTLAEYNADPKAARPAGGGFPSAVNAKAAIFQKNVLAGLTNDYNISSSFKNTTTFYAGFSQVKNSAIRNYERRNEPQFGGRSTFAFRKQHNATEWQLVGGAEFQQGYFNTRVANNKNGNPDTLQTNDDINYTTYSVFLQGDANITGMWFITAGVSINKSKVDFTRLNIYPTIKQSRTYQNEFAPRVSLLRKFKFNLDALATASRGFSPPTTGELLPSTGVISTDLEAEEGWNYELTLRKSFFRNRLQLEATRFYFNLDKALVQRRDLSGADYFVNAGNIKERGWELHADYAYLPVGNKIIDHIIIQGDFTNNHFHYGSFIKGTTDFSGKEVPSVPSNTFSFLADLQLKNGLYSETSLYTSSKIFLNDANTASANAYQLLGWRLGWKKGFQKKYIMNLYTGVDNLLDQKYSLGNDINAAANRFYNAAPGRNYYVGLSFKWAKRSIL